MIELMRWAGFAAGVLGVLSTVGFARADPIVSSSANGGSSDLPVASASFPAEATPIAPAKVDLTSAAPMHVAPAASSAAPPVVTPSLTAPSDMDVVPDHEGASYSIESPTVLELGVLSLVRLIEQRTGLLAVARVVTPSSDEQAFDDAAAKELRRLTFMRRLAQMHDQENEREFSEKLSIYMRKNEFRQAMETQHLAPSPFERMHRQ
jgi:hypothetical protein